MHADSRSPAERHAIWVSTSPANLKWSFGDAVCWLTAQWFKQWFTCSAAASATSLVAVSMHSSVSLKLRAFSVWYCMFLHVMKTPILWVANLVCKPGRHILLTFAALSAYSDYLGLFLALVAGVYSELDIWMQWPLTWQVSSNACMHNLVNQWDAFEFDCQDIHVRVVL